MTIVVFRYELYMVLKKSPNDPNYTFNTKNQMRFTVMIIVFLLTLDTVFAIMGDNDFTIKYKVGYIFWYTFLYLQTLLSIGSLPQSYSSFK
jgi:hypothetical protein